MTTVTKAAITFGLLIATPVAVKTIPFDMAECQIKEADLMSYMQDGIEAADPSIQAEVRNVVKGKLSGSCKDVMKNAMQMMNEMEPPAQKPDHFNYNKFSVE